MTRHRPPASASADLELETRLRALPKAPGPELRFRDELRVQLVAAAQRVPELEHADETATARPRRRVRAPFGLPFRLPNLGQRAYTIVGATLAVLLVITGTTYWLAQRALPGDALYGIKRAGESVDLSTKQGDQSRGNAYLAISTTRIDEAAALVKRSTAIGDPDPAQIRTGYSSYTVPAPLSPRVDGLVHGVLVAGDTAAVTATRLLTEASVAERATHPAASVNGWLDDQQSKVKVLVAGLPETSANTAGGAARMLQRDLNTIEVRIKDVTADLGCHTCQFTTSDRFGPLPCRVCPRPTKTSPPRRSPSSTSPRASSPTTAPASATPTLPSVLPAATTPSSSSGVPPTSGGATVIPSGPAGGDPSTTTPAPTSPTEGPTPLPTPAPTTTLPTPSFPMPTGGSPAGPAQGSSDDPADPTQGPAS